MSPRAAAAAVARGAAATVHAPARTRPARRPAPARRRSGAAARRTARALPRYDFVAVLDRLLRGPAYIAMVGVLLAGIVFFNVDVLELNHGIASTDTRSTQLKRENAALTLQLAKLGSSERIQTVALQRGLVLPQPGDVRYLRADREDAARALRVMTAPDSSSAAPVVPALVSQQSGGASTGTPSQGVTPLQAGDTTPAASTPAPTQQTTVQPTTTQQTTPTTPAQQAPSTQTQTPQATPTQAGATAAPATTAQTTP
jgi:cell division protein FtsL